MNITHLERRKIESGVLVPMIEAFQEAFGKKAANAVAREVILEMARQDGERWAARFGTDLDALKDVSDVWAEGGGLEILPVLQTDDALDFNVTRCRYAEYYQELGLPELGYLFHCSRDFAMIQGFNPALQLKRTQTIMEGASHCDFRFQAPAEEAEE